MLTAVQQQIRRSARRYGVDPLAAEAVARQEGGLRTGAVGDQGTSYGPFQLHEGGALPRGRGAAWANSPAGIDYALRQMSSAGAGGKRGARAIEAIVRGFERPANPEREIARASAAYVKQPQAAAAPTSLPLPSRSRGGLAKALLSYAQTGDIMPVLKAQRRQVTPDGGFTDPHGTLHSPLATRNPGANRVLMAADSQIGKPYQFGSGPDTRSFDCSDLIQWAYKQIGVELPRDTFHQVNAGRPVAGPLKPGDLVFPSPHHVVMYVGGGRVIAAPHTGTVVQYQKLSHFGKPYAVRRVLP